MGNGPETPEWLLLVLRIYNCVVGNGMTTHANSRASATTWVVSANMRLLSFLPCSWITCGPHQWTDYDNRHVIWHVHVPFWCHGETDVHLGVLPKERMNRHFPGFLQVFQNKILWLSLTFPVSHTTFHWPILAQISVLKLHKKTITCNRAQIMH